MGTESHRDEFESLAMPLFDALYNFARWLTRDAGDAEDLVQEAYAKALRGFRGFRPGTDFRAWMFRILKNAFLNSRTALAARHTVPLESEMEESLPGASHTPESLALAAADREAVRQAIADLPPAFREVLLLCDVEEMRYQEIADVLGIPIGTVMSRVSRARRQLRERLQAGGLAGAAAGSRSS